MKELILIIAGFLLVVIFTLWDYGEINVQWIRKRSFRIFRFSIFLISYILLAMALREEFLKLKLLSIGGLIVLLIAFYIAFFADYSKYKDSDIVPNFRDPRTLIIIIVALVITMGLIALLKRKSF